MVMQVEGQGRPTTAYRYAGQRHFAFTRGPLKVDQPSARQCSCGKVLTRALETYAIDDSGWPGYGPVQARRRRGQDCPRQHHRAFK